mmetsp:Transcript_14269/g.35259  ORF Transcript_14269/g.35259 Transcript_14269/m.35259 type:complete len:265 (-) Transcript_14269:814-1608(-)
MSDCSTAHSGDTTVLRVAASASSTPCARSVALICARSCSTLAISRLYAVYAVTRSHCCASLSSSERTRLRQWSMCGTSSLPESRLSAITFWMHSGFCWLVCLKSNVMRTTPSTSASATRCSPGRMSSCSSTADRLDRCAFHTATKRAGASSWYACSSPAVGGRLLRSSASCCEECRPRGLSRSCCTCSSVVPGSSQCGSRLTAGLEDAPSPAAIALSAPLSVCECAAPPLAVMELPLVVRWKLWPLVVVCGMPALAVDPPDPPY